MLKFPSKPHVVFSKEFEASVALLDQQRSEVWQRMSYPQRRDKMIAEDDWEGVKALQKEYEELCAPFEREYAERRAKMAEPTVWASH